MGVINFLKIKWYNFLLARNDRLEDNADRKYFELQGRLKELQNKIDNVFTKNRDELLKRIAKLEKKG